MPGISTFDVIQMGLLVTLALIYSPALLPPQPFHDRTAAIPTNTTTIDNNIYDEWGTHWWDPNHPLRRLNAGRLPYFTEKWLKNDPEAKSETKKYLDIGSGGGICSEALGEQGFNMVGVDISEGCVKVAQDHAREADIKNVKYVVGDAYKLPFADATFDGALSSDVLEHIHDLEKMLNEVRRVLKPGSLFVMDSINRNWKSWIVMILLAEKLSMGYFLQQNSHDWRLFITPGELETVLKRTGFEAASREELRGMSPSIGTWWKIFSKDGGGLYALFGDFHESPGSDLNYLWYARAV